MDQELCRRRQAIKDHETVALFSRWVGDSQVRVRVRKIKETDKIIVELFEFSPEKVEVKRTRLNQIAINAALFNGAGGSDFCVLIDYLTERKCQRLDGTITTTNLRMKSYVFHGMNS